MLSVDQMLIDQMIGIAKVNDQRVPTVWPKVNVCIQLWIAGAHIPFTCSGFRSNSNALSVCTKCSL